MNDLDQLARETAEKIRKHLGLHRTRAHSICKFIQAAIEESTEATSEEFRQGLYCKLDEAIKLASAADASERTLYVVTNDPKDQWFLGKPAHASEPEKPLFTQQITEAAKRHASDAPTPEETRQSVEKLAADQERRAAHESEPSELLAFADGYESGVADSAAHASEVKIYPAGSLESDASKRARGIASPTEAYKHGYQQGIRDCSHVTISPGSRIEFHGDQNLSKEG